MHPLELAARIDTRWLLVVLLAAVDLWSVALVFRARASRKEKLLWSAVIVACPIIGCIIWFVLGPKPTIAGGGGAPDGSWPRKEDVGG